MDNKRIELTRYESYILSSIFQLFTNGLGYEMNDDWELLDDILTMGSYSEDSEKSMRQIIKRNLLNYSEILQKEIGNLIVNSYNREEKLKLKRTKMDILHNKVRLDSVGAIIDINTGMTYPIIDNDIVDMNYGIQLDECPEEWWFELSSEDRNKLVKLGFVK